MARARASSSSKNAAPCSTVGYRTRLSRAVSVMTRSALKPSGTLTTFHKLRSSSAEPPSSASVSAICVVTSANRRRGRALGDDVAVERSPCRSPGAKDGDRRPHADRRPGDDDEQGSHGEDAQVDRRIRDARNARRRHRHERLEEGERDEEPDAARREREQQALGERQARESHPARADGGPDRELPAALADTRQHEVGDVHAGDQQEDGHRAHEQPGDARGIADPPVAQQPHAPFLTEAGRR